MNKKILATVYVVAILAVLLISIIPMPGYLAWILRGGAVLVALAGIYFTSRNKDEYRYTVREEREKADKKLRK